MKIYNKTKRCVFNSSFGAEGNEHFRYYDLRQAEAITLYGQLVILWAQKHLNIFMNKLLKTKDIDYIIASDTDSVYLSMDALVKNMTGGKKVETSKIIDLIDDICNRIIQPEITKIFTRLADYTNAYAQKMHMKREKICDVGIAVGGKNYIWSTWDEEGIRFAKPKISIVGLKMIKSNTPELVRNELKKVVPFFITNNEKDLQAFIKQFKEKQFKTAQLEDVSTPTSMKGLQEYAGGANVIYRKGTPIHVRGSLLYNHYLKENGLEKQYQKIQDGEKIKYVYLKMPNPIKENVIAFPTILPKELGLHKYVDYELQFEKTVHSNIKSILNVLGWDIEEQSSLMDFFSDIDDSDVDYLKLINEFDIEEVMEEDDDGN